MSVSAKVAEPKAVVLAYLVRDTAPAMGPPMTWAARLLITYRQSAEPEPTIAPLLAMFRRVLATFCRISRVARPVMEARRPLGLALPLLLRASQVPATPLASTTIPVPAETQ